MSDATDAQAIRKVESAQHLINQAGENLDFSLGIVRHAWANREMSWDYQLCMLINTPLPIIQGERPTLRMAEAHYMAKLAAAIKRVNQLIAEG